MSFGVECPLDGDYKPICSLTTEPINNEEITISMFNIITVNT